MRARTSAATPRSAKAGRPSVLGDRVVEAERAVEPLADLSRVAECAVSAYPNAGLPNAMGAYDETPHSMEAHYAEWAKAGLVNILGGCCGATPEHISHLAHAVEGVKPRAIPQHEARLRLAGLEPFTAAA